MQDQTNQLLVERMTSLHQDFTLLREGMNDGLKELAQAVNKLVKVEERQSYMARSYEVMERKLEKADVKFESLEARVDVLEKEAPMQRTISKWILAAIGAVISAIAVYGLKLFGIF